MLDGHAKSLSLFEVGVYNSTHEDVEMISKNKRARTVKSGTAGVTPGYEKCLVDLMSASEFWKTVTQEFWLTATATKQLQPKLKANLLELKSADFILGAPTLVTMTADLEQFRASLRKGGFQEFEALLYKFVEASVTKICELKGVDQVNQLGLQPLLEPLDNALAVLSSSPGAADCKKKLSDWFSGLQAEFALDNVKAGIDKAMREQRIDWDELRKAFQAIQGTKFHPEDDDHKYLGIFPLLFAQLRAEAQTYNR